VGRKTTGITKRKFKPNIQRVRALVDGKVCRIKVSTKAIRMGLVVKPPKRNWTKPGAEEAAAPAAAEPTTATAVAEAHVDSAEDADTSAE
jgi:hypothetical protein